MKQPTLWYPSKLRFSLIMTLDIKEKKIIKFFKLQFDHRKYVLWRILMPYLLNIKNLSQDEVTDIILSWLGKCNEIRRLDFSPQLLTRQNIRNAKNHRYLPISYSKLSSENQELFNIISKNGNDG